MVRISTLTLLLFLILPGLAGAEDDAPAEKAAPIPTPWATVRAKLREKHRWRWTEIDPKQRRVRDRLPGSVLLGLRWLAAHQANDGSWKAAAFHLWLDGEPHTPKKTPSDLGLGRALYDTGVTGLALTAFLVAGWDGTGAHAFDTVVRKGLVHLRMSQNAKGCFGEVGISPARHRMPQGRVFDRGETLTGRASWSYNQALAALAMVEAAALTGDGGWQMCAQRAIDYAEIMRAPYFAWGYGEKPGQCNASVTTWMMLALGTARLVNEAAQERQKAPTFTVPEGMFEGVKGWTQNRIDPDTGVLGYTTRGQVSSRNVDSLERYAPADGAPLAAAGFIVRRLLGDRLVARDAAVRTIRDRTPRPFDPADLIYWHLGALGLHAVGGSNWKKWIAPVEERIVEEQRRNDPEDRMFHGSWDPLDAWGAAGGRVYATAINVLTLMTRIRYEGKGR